MGFVVAVVGATGAVGREMIATLEKRNFPVDEIVCLASPRSAGSTMKFRGQDVVVRATSPEAFKGVQIALFSAGASAAKDMGPVAASAGAVVIDNSSAFRQDEGCPLVVPEVNAHAIKDRPKGIIANPNCSTIQMLVALKPLHDAAGLRHIVVSTYQATSGTGHAAVEDLRQQTRALANGEEVRPTIFPGQIAQNLLCDWKPSAMEGGEGYSEEETKMIFETQKIMGDLTIGVSPTCVRVPVVNAHSESIHAKFSRAITVDEVFVGRLRKDFTDPHALNLWVVSDNLLKGAALNAVQIAERVIAE